MNLFKITSAKLDCVSFCTAACREDLPVAYMPADAKIEVVTLEEAITTNEQELRDAARYEPEIGYAYYERIGVF